MVALYIVVKLEPYRADRFMVFLHPELDPRGIGYQINQALLAIGSGGPYAMAAALALSRDTQLDARVIVEKSMAIAAEICIYTNTNFCIEEL